MRIAIVTYRELNPLIGGVERISYDLATKWKDQGHEVVAVCLRRDGQVEHLADFPEYYLPQPDCLSDTCNARYVEEVLIREKVDILLNQVIVEPKFARICCDAARSVKVKIVSCMHYDIYQHVKDVENSFFIPEKNGACLKKWGMDLMLWLRFHLYRKRQLIYEAESVVKQAAAQSDALVFLADASVKQCEQWIESGKSYYIPNGIDIKTQNADAIPKKKQVIYVGRLEYGAKRVDRFIRIWASLEKKHSDWSALIVGDGGVREKLELLSQRLGCERLTFEGFQSPESYYREASILCLTSSSEGFGMVLVESMQYGCIPVLFDSFPAASEIVDDSVNGCLVKPFNKKDFAHKLSMLMGKEEERERIAIAAKSKALQYDINPISQKWMELFAAVLNN